MKLLKDKKGQQIFVGIMVFIMVLAAVIVLITPIKSQITSARATNKLDCSNSSISVGQKGGCILVDLALPYFIGITLAAAASYITMKKIGVFG